MRMVDEHGRQIVQVEFLSSGATRAYAYAWNGPAPLKVGDRVLLPPNWVNTESSRGVVVALGSEYIGELVAILARFEEDAEL